MDQTDRTHHDQGPSLSPLPPGHSGSGEDISDHLSDPSPHQSPLSPCSHLTELSQHSEKGDVSLGIRSDISLSGERENNGCQVCKSDEGDLELNRDNLHACSMSSPEEKDIHHEEERKLNLASAGTEDNVCAVLPSVRRSISNETRICSLCDDVSIVAATYCSECDDNLCSACVHRHRRMSLVAHHDVRLFQVQQLDDGSSGCLSAAPDRLSIHSSILAVVDPCHKHPGERLRFFCNSCQKPVCRDCILTTHKQHVTQDIADATFAARKELVDMLAQLEKKKALLVAYYDSFEDYKSQFERHAQQVEEMMRSFYGEVKTAIDVSLRKLVGDLEECRRAELERIQNQESVIQNNIEDVTRLLHKQNLNMDSSIHILNRHEMVSQALKTLSENVQQIDMVQGEFFIAKNARLATIPEHFLGQVTFTTHTSPWPQSPEDTPSRTVIRDVQLRRELAFNIHEPSSFKSTVQSIVETPNRTIWVATPQSILKVTGKVTKETTNVPDSIASIAAGPGEKLLVSLGQGNTIKVYTNGSWTPFISTPKGSMVMASRVEHHSLEVYVAVTPQMSATRIVSYSSEGRVCHQVRLPAHVLHSMTQDPTTVHSPEAARCAEMISSSSSCKLKPTCMAVGREGRLYLGDMRGRRLLILDSQGEVTGQYLGTDGQSGCHPCGVCIVAPGQVAVADSERCTVQLVNAEGKLLAPLLSRDQLQADSGVATCLMVDSKQRLWIGTSRGHVYAFSFLHTWPSA